MQNIWKNQSISGDLYNMQMQPNTLEITEVYEIRLNIELWQRVKRLAEKYKVSYSWIVRMCVIAVIDEAGNISQNWQKSSDAVKLEYRNPLIKLHRHMLCLYGEDGLLLRLVSARRRMTISHLVRVALHIHLPKLEQRNHISEENLLKEGVKITQKLELAKVNAVDTFFHIKRLKFMPYLKAEYRAFRPKIAVPLFSG